MKGWNIIGLLKRGDRSGISMHVFKAALLLVLLVLGMMVNAGPAVADALTDSEKSQVQEAVDNMGIGDVQSDFNVPVPMTKVENPVGYDCNLWITALHHKNPVAGTNSIKRPTILVATGYHRDIIGTMFSVIGFLPYDYNIVVLDMRGTGSAEGVWDPLSPIEAYDVAYLIDKWIPSQPWSDGKVGMVGGSYMGIIQYLAAGLVEKDANDVPVHLKAIAPLSAYNDVWKDIVMHGGNFDLEFMAIWILLTDMISIFPPDLLLGGASAPGFNMTDVENAFKIWGQHFNQLGVPLQWIMNPAQLKKNDWYETKSPMIYWPDKPAGGWHFAGMPAQVGGGVIPSKLPVFTATGWFDIFERGSLMNWEYGLKNHASGDKCMIVGPWYHIEAAFMYTGVNGLGLLGKNSLFTWDILRRWMDWRIKGKPDPFMQQYPVLLYVLEQKNGGRKSPGL